MSRLWHLARFVDSLVSRLVIVIAGVFTVFLGFVSVLRGFKLVPDKIVEELVGAAALMWVVAVSYYLLRAFAENILVQPKKEKGGKP